VEIDVEVYNRRSKVFSIIYLLPMKKHLCLVIFFYSSKECKERISIDRGWKSSWFLYTRIELISVLVWYMSRKVQAESLRDDNEVFIGEFRVFIWPRMVEWVMVFVNTLNWKLKDLCRTWKNWVYFKYRFTVGSKGRIV